MKPVIAIAFINKDLAEDIDNEELITFKSKTNYIIRPKDFQELKDKIQGLYKPKEKKSEITYNGLLPSGERIKITDDKIFQKQKDISIIFVYYNKIKKNFDIKNMLPKIVDDQEEITLPEDDRNTNIDKYINTLPAKIKLDFSDDRIINLKKSLSGSLNESVEDLLLHSSRENMKKSCNDLKSSVNHFSSKTLNNKKITFDLIRKNSQKFIDMCKENFKKKLSDDKKDKKAIFIFNKPIFKVEAQMKKGQEKILVKVEGLQIRNKLDDDYEDKLISLFKEEDKSDKNIDFAQEKLSNEMPLGTNIKVKGREVMQNLSLNLIVNEPKEDSEYKMFVSIINKKKKIISEKPVQIVVKTEKKSLSKDEIHQILDNLKEEFDNLNLFLDDNQLTGIITDKDGEENEIKIIVKEKYENLKETKVNKLLGELKDETNYSRFLDDNVVKEKIIGSNFNKEEIKKWIKEKEQEQVGPDEGNRERIQNIINIIEENYNASSFIKRELLVNQIIQLNYDINAITEWVEEQM